MAIREYFLENLFPRRSTNLLCGPSGAGKTRWLLPAVADWLDSKPILGLKSSPDKCAYISERPSMAANELIDLLSLRTRLPKDRLPVYSLMDKGRDFDWKKIPEMVGPDIRVLFIEAFQVLIPQGKINDYWRVMDFFRQWNQMLEECDLSVLGMCHEPKMRENDGYLLQRDQVMGSVAWGAATEGIITLNYAEPGNLDNSNRLMTILPRHQKPWQVSWKFSSQGHLIETEVSGAQADVILGAELVKRQPGEIPVDDILAWGKRAGIHRATVFRWIAKQPFLRRVRHGFYAYDPESETPS